MPADQPIHDRSAFTPDWWTEFFNEEYAAYGLAGFDPALNAQTAEFLIRALQLSPGDLVFDQCCGIGRISLPLAERGVEVIGVDLSRPYVQAAEREAAKRRLPCRFHHGDAFEFIAPEPCDAAINWFTSFGYTDDDARNAQMIRRAFESLKPGGRFAMDYLNVPRMMAEFRPAMIDRPKVPGLEGTVVLQENSPDFLRGMMLCEWSVFSPDGRRTRHHVETRMYMPHTLAQMVREAGFTDVGLVGWIDGTPHSRESRRCIVIARKP